MATKKEKQIHFSLPLSCVPSLNQLYAANKFRRATLAAESHEAVVAHVWEVLGTDVQPLEGPVLVTITAFSPVPRDPDNIAKTLLDGMVMARVLKSDDWKYIHELRLMSRKDTQHPHIEVSITQIPLY